MKRAMSLVFATAAASVFGQQFVYLEATSDGPFSYGAGNLYGGPGPHTLSFGGQGCGTTVSGAQDWLEGSGRARTTADWTGFLPFHTAGVSNPFVQERIWIGSLSGNPIEVLALLDFSFTADTAGRQDFVDWDVEGGNKYRGSFSLLFGPVSWEATFNPVRGFESTPGFSVRTLSSTNKQLAFKRTFPNDTRFLSTRSFAAQVQAGNPGNATAVQLDGWYKLRFKTTQPDGFVLGPDIEGIGQANHSGSLLDRIVTPETILEGTKRNATCYLSSRSAVDRRVYLKAVPETFGSIIKVPAYITIPAGQTSKLFGIDVVSLPGGATDVTIMAVHDAKLVTSTILATPFPITVFDVAPDIIHGGQIGNGTLRLALNVTGPVFLSDTSDLVAILPEIHDLPFGGQSTFNVITQPVTSNQAAVLSARRDVYTKTKLITIVPASTLTSFTVAPTTVIGGNPATTTSRVSGPAPLGGANVRLSSSNGFAMLPPNVVIPQGTTFAPAAVTTLPTSFGRTAILVASLNGVTKTATLLISP